MKIEKQVVWKFKIWPGESEPDAMPVFMPTMARVLSVGAQGEEIFLWAEVNPEAPAKVCRTFLAEFTGRPLSAANRSYIGTAHTESGLVIHVYEAVNVPDACFR